MANQRADGQVLIGFWADAEFASRVDAARGDLPRSQFLRSALADALRRRGYPVPARLIHAPDRSGKGGPRSKSPPFKYPPHVEPNVQLNDK